ncbi:MAG: hypothetical protein K6U00_04665 [Armatimonadetes bacterium]|nr:hypothetical protein [Armatimonadota bacterium]
MKRVLVMLTLLAAIPTAASAFTFADIQFWVGSGGNQAALVIDWYDGKHPVSLAWGFRWDGTATGRTMLDAIKMADPRLFENYCGPTVVFGLGYDLDGDGFTYVPGTNETGYAADPDDHYQEGWMTAGYWSYWIKSNTESSWGWSMGGITDRILTDGCWDGWKYAPAPIWDSGEPSEPVAATVPEANSLLGLAGSLFAMGGLVVRRWFSQRTP